MNTIEIYVKSNTNYNKNGDITLDPILCTYKDSEKLLTLEHFQDEEGRWKYIEFENVIAIEENEKKILYRIYNVVRSLYKVIAYARPIFYDLVDEVLLDVRPTNKLGQEAINIILAGTGFTGHSNLTTLSTSYYIRKNIVEALIGKMDNSFINRWGGEFYCENYDIYINDRIGSDNGVKVEFGYNLNEIEEDINIENVVTRIIPVGYNGIMLDGNSPWVDSPLINKYEHIKMRVIEFSDVKLKENSTAEEGFNTISEARAELRRRCNELFDEGIDRPTVNYKIDMINLANTTEYESFKMLVSVKKGDTVTCYVPHLDIDVKARVIDFEEDKITGEYISIELGNALNDFFKDQADMLTIVNKITNSNGTVNAGEIQGVINAIQTQFKALRDIAQPQDVRAILFEDRVENSPTFGCMVLGTMGFEIASKFKPGTQDWDFRTFGTGQGFIADCLIAGTLMSRNGLSWFNLDNGTFSYGNGALKFDGSNLAMESTDGTYGVKLSNGTLEFKVTNEIVGGVVATRFADNELINGLNIANAKNGDYIDIGRTDSIDFRGGSSFTPIIRIANVINELLGNFKGIQLLENTRIRKDKKLYIESSENNSPHEFYNSAAAALCVFGNNGIILGYKNGEEKVNVIEIFETPNEIGTQVYINKQLSMYGNNITSANEIYRGANTGRYYHEGWCGSIEATAKRISNLNVFLDSGWYAYSDGANGAPSNYGILLHFKWNSEDFVQIAFDFANTMYQRAWVNGAWTNWSQR